MLLEDCSVTCFILREVTRVTPQWSFYLTCLFQRYSLYYVLMGCSVKDFGKLYRNLVNLISIMKNNYISGGVLELVVFV